MKTPFKTGCLTAFVCIVLLAVGVVAWQYLPAPISLTISSTKWVIPKIGSNHVTFKIIGNAHIYGLQRFVMPDGFIVLGDEQRGGYTVFPDDEVHTTHVPAPDSRLLVSKENKTKITLIADLYRDSDGKRYLCVNNNQYPLKEIGSYIVVVSCNGYEQPGEIRSNWVYVNVSDE